MGGLVGSAGGGASIGAAKGVDNSDSGGGGGAVDQIIAGPGIGVAPPAGTGPVTVSNTGVRTLATTKPGDSVNAATGAITISGGGLARVANLTALGALAAAGFPIGNTFCWVDTVGAYYQLQTSALATTTTTVIAASGAAGARWLRMDWLNPVWQAQTTWTVNTSTGNDENAGTGGAPLLTVSEVARRLSYARITAATTVQVTGNMAAGDQPSFTFTCKIFNGFTIAGVPTVLYTGSVTGSTQVAAAPTTTENNLTDSAIPVSFTASGLLANGVLFQRTNGSPAQWWAMKDLGSKTIRISQPQNAATFTNTTIANADTYTASALPQMSQMSFSEVFSDSVLLQNFLVPSGTKIRDMCIETMNCFHVSATQYAAVLYVNPAFQGSAQLNGAYTGLGIASTFGGMGRGTGASSLDFFQTAAAEINNGISLQGYGVICQSGFLNIAGDVLSYDSTSAGGPVQASYWGIVLWSSGAFGGSNNAKLGAADRMSYIGHVASPLWLAGSSTDAVTPINVSGTAPMSVATETAGGGAVNAQQNGIFQST
jgi:hypothetical protein